MIKGKTLKGVATNENYYFQITFILTVLLTRVIRYAKQWKQKEEEWKVPHFVKPYVPKVVSNPKKNKSEGINVRVPVGGEYITRTSPRRDEHPSNTNIESSRGSKYDIINISTNQRTPTASERSSIMNIPNLSEDVDLNKAYSTRIENNRESVNFSSERAKAKRHSRIHKRLKKLHTFKAKSRLS